MLFVCDRRQKFRRQKKVDVNTLETGADLYDGYLASEDPANFEVRFYGPFPF